MYFFIKRLLFVFSPEVAHKFSMKCLNIANRVGLLKLFFEPKVQPFLFSSLTFKNRLGLAAGFDKNAEYIESLAALGFGFIEIGTVTPMPQEGNPLPRLFRLTSDHALLNRMGFNNKGVDQIVQNLKKITKRDYIIGGNIGKNKITPNENAVDDYLICFEKLYEYVDYFTINVSSPNTPNLRELQEKDSLYKIIQTLEKHRNTKPVSKPIFLKIAPDLSTSQLDDIIDVYNNSILDALIVSNTTIDYDVLHLDKSLAISHNTGGISGRPIATKCNAVIKYIKSKDSNIAIIGVGGIDSKASASDKMYLGCDLLQIYTGFIYKGPKVIKEILSVFSSK